MAFDISRYTFNPWNDYLGVVMQQGRVHLDSDWNELLAELTRRIHAGTLDVIGLSGVPSTTPFGFQITPTRDSAGIHLSIGVGRMYVDGILAENHGSAGALQWDPTLADFSGSTGAPLDYTAQPYVLGALMPPDKTGPYLVYLDVWQREVSYLEDPSLVDPAVGIDTTGRLQTVWQVKLLDVSAFAAGFAGSTADSALWSATTGIPSGPIWQTLAQGSPSLLTNGPSTGYTGQENQLYRVEIDQGGSPASASTLPVAYPPAAGTATFKWSRENASVTTAVTAISAATNSLGQSSSQLTVVSLGRDQVLGFSPGDWIEITDDYLELNGTSAQPGSASSTQPGELHLIDSINAAALTITLDTPVIATNFPLANGATDPTRHTRIRRWDQTGTVYLADGQTAWANLQSSANLGTPPPSNSAIPVPPPGTSLILENGITVAFDLNAAGAGAFQTGDYWTFAARTADGSVAPLTLASPAGIDHHICRLAIVDFTASPQPSVVDCRTVFQSLSNPSIHVTGLGPAGASQGAQLVAGGTLSVQDLSNGINIYFDSPIAAGIIGSIAPICFITVQLPDASGGWLNPVILAGTVTTTAETGIPRSITWTPSPGMEAPLLAQVSPTKTVLARLTLKGDTIWADGGPPNIYLNGSGVADGRAYADFDLWFWINSQPPVSLSATALSFGSQTVGTSSGALPVTLYNNSSGQLTFPGSGISITGANAADFGISNNTCGTGVAGSASCSISVVFAPTSVSPFASTRTASLSIQESIDASAQIVTLTGTALAPWLLATPTSLSFPATVVNQTSTLTVTLSNSGTAALSISAISITGTAPASTAAAPAAAPALAVTKLLESKAVETKVLDTKAIETKAVETKVVETKVLETKLLETKAVETKNVETKTFDKIAEKIQDVIVLPTGSTAAPGDFSQTSNCVPPGGGTLQPGQACTITVSFTPSATGVRSAFLQITHNAAGSVNSIPLSGSGILQTKLREVKVVDKTFDTVKAADLAKVGVSGLARAPAATPAEKPAGAAENPALKSFITPEERPPVAPPASDATPGDETKAKPRNKPKPR
jgi:hypothetical protein